VMRLDAAPRDTVLRLWMSCGCPHGPAPVGHSVRALIVFTSAQDEQQMVGGLLQVADVVDTDYAIRCVADRPVSSGIRLPENIHVAVEGLVLPDEIDRLAFGVENGANGARPIVLFYVGGDPDELVTILDEDRSGSTRLLNDVVNQGKVVV